MKKHNMILQTKKVFSIPELAFLQLWIPSGNLIEYLDAVTGNPFVGMGQTFSNFCNTFPVLRPHQFLCKFNIWFLVPSPLVMCNFFYHVYSLLASRAALSPDTNCPTLFSASWGFTASSILFTIALPTIIPSQ